MKSWQTANGYLIRKVLGGRSNVFLVSRNNIHLLIDTSPGRKWNKLNRRLRSLGISSIDYLVITHSHYDHAANAGRVKKQYSAKVIVSEKEAADLEYGRNAPIEGSLPPTRILVRLIKDIFIETLHFEGCKPDIEAGLRYDIPVDGLNAYIINTPGHSPGSQSLIVDNEIAIVGDAMFGVFKGSIFPPYAIDIPEMIRSWGKLLGTGSAVFLPSHGNENARQLVEKEYKRKSRIHTI